MRLPPRAPWSLRPLRRHRASRPTPSCRIPHRSRVVPRDVRRAARRVVGSEWVGPRRSASTATNPASEAVMKKSCFTDCELPAQDCEPSFESFARCDGSQGLRGGRGLLPDDARASRQVGDLSALRVGARLHEQDVAADVCRRGRGVRRRWPFVSNARRRVRLRPLQAACLRPEPRPAR